MVENFLLYGVNYTQYMYMYCVEVSPFHYHRERIPAACKPHWHPLHPRTRQRRLSPRLRPHKPPPIQSSKRQRCEQAVHLLLCMALK